MERHDRYYNLHEGRQGTQEETHLEPQFGDPVTIHHENGRKASSGFFVGYENFIAVVLVTGATFQKDGVTYGPRHSRRLLIHVSYLLPAAPAAPPPAAPLTAHSEFMAVIEDAQKRGRAEVLARR